MTSCALLLVSAAAAGPLPDSVLLDFSATWCGPCQRVKPTVNKLIRQGHPVRKIDIDRSPKLTRRFRIHSVPTFVLLVNGKEVQRVSGYQSERDLRRMLARIPAVVRGQESGGRAKGTTHHSPLTTHQPPESLYAQRSPKRRFQPPRQGPAAKGQESGVREQGTTHGHRPQVGPPLTTHQPGITIRGNNGDAPLAKADAVPADPMAASVRIRVRDGNGINYGSGSVIDSRPGRSIVLTCAHVFRGVKGKAAVEVDLFEDGQVRQFNGTVITYDLKADVGLVSIPTKEPIPTVPVAPSGTPIRAGDGVLGIGCGGGDPPKRLSIKVTAVNRYLGPDNLECSGMPQQGRSGGGLFDATGRLIGVCFAAEPKNRRGLYAGLRPIHALLKRADVRLAPPREKPGFSTTNIAHQASDPSNRNPRQEEAGLLGADRESATAGDKPAIRIDQRQLALMQVPVVRVQGSAVGDDSPLGADAGVVGQAQVADYDPGPFPLPKRSATQPEPMARSKAAPKEAPEHRLQPVDDVVGKVGEAEVVCIIRPLDDPRAASRVVIINRASPKFVRYLRNEVDHTPRKTNYRTVSPAETRGSHSAPTTPFRQVSRATATRPNPEPGRYRRSAATRFSGRSR